MNALDFDQADPTRADRLEPFDVAKGRDANPRLLGRFQDHGPFGYLNVNIVDRQ